MDLAAESVRAILSFFADSIAASHDGFLVVDGAGRCVHASGLADVVKEGDEGGPALLELLGLEGPGRAPLAPDALPLTRALAGTPVRLTPLTSRRLGEQALSAMAGPVLHGGHVLGAWMSLSRCPHWPAFEAALAAERDSRAGSELREAQLCGLMVSLEEGVTLLDSQGKVLLRNPAMRRLTGEGEDLPGPFGMPQGLHLESPTGERLPDDAWPGRRLLAGEPVRSEEYVFRCADGERRVALVSGRLVRDSERQPSLALLMARDVTKLRDLEKSREEDLATLRRLKESREEDLAKLRRLQADQDDFLRAISHDLRQPLSVIMVTAQWMARRHAKAGISDSETAALDRIHSSGRRMTGMIQDLVDSARFEAGKFELKLAPADLSSFVRTSLEKDTSLQDQARIAVEADAIAPVLADVPRLERALMNLVGNALKYSPPEAKVQVRVACARGMASVSVVDRGPGIPHEELEHLFQRYGRGAGARRAEGLGLGLFVAKKLVEAHGGRIQVESKVGEGSTFRIELPLASPAHRASAAPPPA